MKLIRYYDKFPESDKDGAKRDILYNQIIKKAKEVLNGTKTNKKTKT